jgi:hypothetical protein
VPELMSSPRGQQWALSEISTSSPLIRWTLTMNVDEALIHRDGDEAFDIFLLFSFRRHGSVCIDTSAGKDAQSCCNIPVFGV